MTTPSNFSIRCSPPPPQRYCTSPCSTMAWMHLLPSRAASRAGRRPFGLFQEALSLSGVWWRRGRDSNPRYGYPYAAFRVRCFQPLSHLSKVLNMLHFQADFRVENGWFATVLLPIGFEASVYSSAHRQVNAIGRLGLQTGQDMAVEIDRNRHAGMAETL